MSSETTGAAAFVPDDTPADANSVATPTRDPEPMTPVALVAPATDPDAPVAAASDQAADDDRDAEPALGKNALRETCDCILLTVAIILLVRGFVAEPFEIPTGSMGPTLLGRHKQVRCPACGFTYDVSTSDEIDLATGLARPTLTHSECPNCREEIEIDALPSLRGDRILVLKDPPAGYRRFDVVVFKNVDSPRKYYVKRLVGLPGETIRIHRGEVEIHDAAADRWNIAAKSADQIQTMALPVYDDRFRDPTQPLRWVPVDAKWDSVGSTYVLTSRLPESADRSGSRTPAEQRHWQMLEYRHHLPGMDGPTLITDQVAYNSAQAKNAWSRRSPIGHPVSDLILSFTIDLEGLTPQDQRFGAELVVGKNLLSWTYSAVSGTHEFFHDGKSVGKLAAGMIATGRFTFAHVDSRLWLWQGDEFLGSFPVDLGDASDRGPWELDLKPVRILAAGAGTQVSDLVLRRDIYYSRQSQSLDFHRPEDVDEFLQDPSRWRRLRELRPQFRPWKLGSGEYAFLGDNSARSSDSRHWRVGPTVPAPMIVGKAILVVWPLSERTGRIW